MGVNSGGANVDASAHHQVTDMCHRLVQNAWTLLKADGRDIGLQLGGQNKSSARNNREEDVVA